LNEYPFIRNALIFGNHSVINRDTFMY